MTEAYLVDIDCMVRTHEDGLTALTLIADEPPDSVVLDAHMPDMDGYGILRSQLRDHLR